MVNRAATEPAHDDFLFRNRSPAGALSVRRNQPATLPAVEGQPFRPNTCCVRLSQRRKLLQAMSAATWKTAGLQSCSGMRWDGTICSFFTYPDRKRRFSNERRFCRVGAMPAGHPRKCRLSAEEMPDWRSQSGSLEVCYGSF